MIAGSGATQKTITTTLEDVNVLAVTSPAAGSTLESPDNKVTWTGNAPAGSPVRVTTTGGRTIATGVADDERKWALRGNLAYNVMYTVNVTATIDGEDSTTQHQVQVTPPFEVTSPRSGSTVSDSANRVTWTGSAPAGTPIRIATTGGRTIATTKADTTGQWAARGTLAYDLMYTVNITATINGRDTTTEHQVKVVRP